jgi:hypothetical protein
MANASCRLGILQTLSDNLIIHNILIIIKMLISYISKAESKKIAADAFNNVKIIMNHRITLYPWNQSKAKPKADVITVIIIVIPLMLPSPLVVFFTKVALFIPSGSNLTCTGLFLNMKFGVTKQQNKKLQRSQPASKLQ